MRCPECGANGYSRKTRTPEWRCRKCGHEWDVVKDNPIADLAGCPECGANGYQFWIWRGMNWRCRECGHELDVPLDKNSNDLRMLREAEEAKKTQREQETEGRTPANGGEGALVGILAGVVFFVVLVALVCNFGEPEDGWGGDDGYEEECFYEPNWAGRVKEVCRSWSTHPDEDPR